ncbi:hypothetical protein ACN4FW_11310, partial [Aliarcobacter butzleri]|uniref:hypothetical protein n=2 Tax=Aliarcobacter butzleri TaxID=28197 RepID=UPI003AF8F5C8
LMVIKEKSNWLIALEQLNKMKSNFKGNIMYELSKEELIARIQELQIERDEILSLYLTASRLLTDTNNYIATLWSDKADLQEEIIVLKESKKINFSVQEEFANIKAELRELDEKKKGENNTMENQNDKNL